MDSIIIYCDGSSRGNPGAGGWGVVIQYPDRTEEFGGYQEQATNNQMELKGAITALERVKEYSGKVVIRSDSQYVIKGITEWISGWKRKNWQTSAGKPVLNRELWEQLDALTITSTHSTRWEHVRGHSGEPGNERADAIATSFADQAPIANDWQSLT